MARPNKYESHVVLRMGEIEDWVRNGATDKEIYDRLGISEDSFYKYKKEFSEFSEVLKRTRDEVDGEVESALLKAAKAGNITAQIFWLKNRRPRQWRDKPINDGVVMTDTPSFVFSIEDCSGSGDDNGK